VTSVKPSWRQLWAEVRTALRAAIDEPVPPCSNQPCRGPFVRKGDARGERRAMVAEFRVAGPALLQLLPEAVSVDQHIVRFSKLLLLLVAQPALFLSGR
jgi:hypothetical protein